MVQQLEPLEDIFLAALERTSANARRAFLDAACADAAMRERIEELLSAHEEAGNFLETPPEPLAPEDQKTLAASGLATECDPRPARSAPPPEPPADAEMFGDFGPYRIVGIIGQGGMGMVFLGHEARLSRSVAIKVLNPALASDPAARERFLREARTAAAVRHEHVITIHAIDEIKGMPYLVMEHVQGESLQDRLGREGPLPVDDVLRIGEQVASGLAAAHAQGLIHRDIKPANILVDAATGKVKIADFGLARPADEGGITLSGVVAGSPQYMSPEQAHGRHADERSDLFSLGCLLYALSVGRSPFHASTAAAALERVRNAAVEPVTRYNPAAPAWLAEIIGRLLQKDPDDRIQTAGEVIDALRQRGALPAERDQKTAPRRGAGWRRRTVVAMTVIPTAAILGAVALQLGLRHADVPDTNAKVDPPAVKEAPKEAPGVKGTPTPTPPPADDHRYGEIRRMAALGQLKSLALSPDEKRIYVGGHTGNIHVWDLATGDEVNTISVRSPVMKVRMSGDGARLAVAAPNLLCVFDPQTGAERHRISLAISIHEMAFLADHRHLLIACSAGPGVDEAAKWKPGALFDNRALTVFDTGAGEKVRTLNLEQPTILRSVACSPDGKWLAAGGEDSSVFLLDAAKGTQERALKTTNSATYAVAFSRDSQRLFASDGGNYLHGWRLSDFQEIGKGRYPHPFTRFALSPDGSWLALNGERELSLFDLTSRLAYASTALPGHESVISDVAFLSNGEQLVTCSWDSTARLWKVPPRPKKK